MFAHPSKVLLVLPRDLLDQARVLAGQATVIFKLPVSLQIVLRALIGEGLKRAADPALFSNLERQAKEVRHLRGGARRGGLVATRGGETGRRRRP